MEKIIVANKNKILRLFENPLLAGSAVLFIGNMIANVANYLYHLLMGRMLGPSDYGILESLISLLYLMEIPLMTLGVVIVKYVSQFKGEERYQAIGKFYHKLISQLLIICGIGGFVYLLLSPLIKNSLRLDNYLWLIIVGLIIFVTFFSGINRSVLQGLSNFTELSLIIVCEGLAKFILAICFIYLGLKITGAVGAMLVAGIIGFLLSKHFVKDKVSKIDLSENLGRKTMIKYSFPIFLSMLSLTSFFSTDIILARYYLSSVDAGYYSALAVLGKIIFFVSGPISTVMLPLISENRAKGANYRKIFLQSLVIVSSVCIGMTAIYFLFPKPIISMLYGESYLIASSSLGLFGIFLSFYSIINLFVSYYISTNEFKIISLTLPAAVLQILLISVFHQDINQLILVSIALMSLLAVILMVYYLYEKNGKKVVVPLGYRSGL